MLSKYDYEKLLHDLKRISKGIRLIKDEKNKEKRVLLGGLLADEVDRLHSDLEEIRKHNNNGKQINE